MTTETARLRVALAMLVAGGVVAGAWLALGGCGGVTRRPDGLDVATLPADVQPAYDVFEVRCSRCHSLARPLNADIDDAGFWEDYVARMRRQPGSGISARDATEILRFLRYYTGERLRRERGDDRPSGAPAPAPAPAASRGGREATL